MYYSDGMMYVLRDCDVTTIIHPEIITDGFERYADCLTYAKKFIQEQIEKGGLPLDELLHSGGELEFVQAKQTIKESRQEPERER
jgi:hypothetical protein